MAGKSLPPVQVVTAGDMSQASLTSSIVDVSRLDNVAVAFVGTGTPTGTFGVNASLDYNPLTGAGTWIAVSLSPAPAASGSAGNAMINLAGVAFPYIQATYTKTSGSGSLNAYISGKAVGQ